MKSFHSENFRLGILGGGQLGRMLIQEAISYDINISVMDPSPEAPCSGIAHNFVVGDFNDYDSVYRFGKTVDLLTIEIEHVNTDALIALKSEGVGIYPDPEILRIIKDKGLQKQFYRIHKVDTTPFHIIETKKDIEHFSDEFPLIQKLRNGGYDGKGVHILNTVDDIETAFDAPSILERVVDFEKEIAVIVARNPSGEVSVYPLIEMEFNNEANVVELLFSPANVNEEVQDKVLQLAHRIVDGFSFVGILAIELFITKSGDVMVNEIAPRPHNSGHHTIEGCVTSQYEQHLRAILNLPLGNTALIQPAAMVNLLGEKGFAGPVLYEGLEETMSIPGAYLHLYGKSTTKPFRKMGHVTVVHKDIEFAKKTARKILSLIKVRSKPVSFQNQISN